MTKPFSFAILALTLLAGCRHYDMHARVTDQAGLIPADQWAAYGQEQAQAIAIGRAFGASFESTAPEARGRQMSAAVEFAASVGAIVEVADTLGYRLEVKLPSGWRRAILPIDDGTQ
jgi:hypothetical protein